MEIENVMIKSEHVDDEDCCNIIEAETDENDVDDAETSNEKPYKCGICGHRTTSDTLLKVHMKMHLVKRIHQCNVCKRTFNFVTELNSHILTHTEDKTNFQCEVCGRNCFTEEDLHKHYRIHTKEKPFKCKLCFRSFSDDSYLRVHERSHHGEDYLRKIMKNDGTYVDPSVIQNLNEDGTPKVSIEKTTEPKKAKQNQNSPLNSEEKLLLLQYAEKLELNKKYLQLEQIKTYLKNGWGKMVELFAGHDYDRNPEKLTRTYFHLKNQAKTHIERFYKYRKLPEPHEIDYMFVKLCPTEFDIPGIDIEKVIEDSKRFTRASSVEVVNECILSPETDNNSLNEDVDLFLQTRDDGSSECASSIKLESSSLCQKRIASQQDDGPPSKMLKNEDEDDITDLKIKCLLKEEQRKDHLYKTELKEKEELFDMEKKHREEVYRKELEIKNLELTLLKQKIPANIAKQL